VTSIEYINFSKNWLTLNFRIYLITEAFPLITTSALKEIILKYDNKLRNYFEAFGVKLNWLKIGLKFIAA
jgi:hypothetical protein